MIRKLTYISASMLASKCSLQVSFQSLEFNGAELLAMSAERILKRGLRQEQKLDVLTTFNERMSLYIL